MRCQGFPSSYVATVPCSLAWPTMSGDKRVTPMSIPEDQASLSVLVTACHDTKKECLGIEWIW